MHTENPHKRTTPVDGGKPDDKTKPVVEKATKVKPLWYQAVETIASLKFTVALMAMSILIVLFGTLAQDGRDVWLVIRDYFRIQLTSDMSFTEVIGSGFAKIKVSLLFPKAFFSTMPKFAETSFFYFPKGWLIGFFMAINLAAAHSIRFKVQAKGNRLVLGIITLIIGFAVTWLVILSGDNKDGIQEFMFDWEDIQIWFKVAMGVGSAACIATAVAFGLGSKTVENPKRKTESYFLAGIGGVLGIGFMANLIMGDFNPSSMRILWQLIKGEAAALALLAGCMLIFKKRGGIVLLHGGIGLLMFSELLVGTTAVEGIMTLAEGEAKNYLVDQRTYELAIVNRSLTEKKEIGDEKIAGDNVYQPSEQDEHAIIPESILARNAGKEEPIQHEGLPFDIKVDELYVNSQVLGKDRALSKTNQKFIVNPIEEVSGVSTGGELNCAGGLITLIHNKGEKKGKEIRKLYVSTRPTNQSIEEKVQVGDQTYFIELRFKRMYQPWSVQLVDVVREDHPGTMSAKSYESKLNIHVVNEKDDSKDEKGVKTWMNNPLRYAGVTFYQSGYDERTLADGSIVELTTLQVVTNNGWMIPYVCCMIVGTGMIAHFLIILLRFINRGQRKTSEDGIVVAEAVAVATESQKKHKRGKQKKKHPQNELVESELGQKKYSTGFILSIALSLFFVLLYCGYYAGKSVPKSDDINLSEFASLPALDGGRVQPLNSIARIKLRQISNRQTYFDTDGKRQPAIKLMLEILANPDAASELELIYIDSNEVLNEFNLERRKGLRYSYKEVVFAEKEVLENEEVFEGNKVLDRKVTKKVKIIEEIQKKTAELRRKLRTKEIKKKDLSTKEKKLLDLENRLAVFANFTRILGFVPKETKNKNDNWVRLSQGQSLPAHPKVTQIIDEYKKGDAEAFDSKVALYQAYLDDVKPVNYDRSILGFESTFNRLEMFYHSAVLYAFAFVVVLFAWLLGNKHLMRAAIVMVLATFAIHTIGIVCRMYISGRPPVTTLYTTALFIGWGCVLAGLVIEWYFKIGVGVAISAISGFMALMIGHLLITLIPNHQGDQFKHLEAVLDTQIWLATHVVTINLGYAATLLAGLLATIYIIMGVCSPNMDEKTGKDITRMTYAAICFAIWFSFVGTVLGGLWGDDSWGRFWGWDPKENGALMIVIWNALVLHARWGKMIGERGLAVLAIGGNIITAWSWWGVNELGVGLHAYGTTEGVVKALMIYWGIQFVLIAMGCLPKEFWWSYRVQEEMQSRKPPRRG